MIFRSLPGKAGLLGVALGAAFFVLIGCSNTDNTSDANNPAPKTGAPPAGAPKSDASTGAPKSDASTASTDPGQQVFSAKCAGCHSINGVGGKKGPDLSHAGAEAEHTPEWLTAFINDPKSKKPNARMPGFAGKITDDEMKSLTTYLAGLK